MTFTPIAACAAVILGLGALTCLHIFVARTLYGSRRAADRTAVDILDTPLLYLTPCDPFSVRSLLAGGVAIFGIVGSGKTSSSGKMLASRIVGSQRTAGRQATKLRMGGLILAAKPEDLAMWQRIFAKAGRSNDLLVFSPECPLRFNFLDYEMKHGGHTRNIT